MPRADCETYLDSTTTARNASGMKTFTDSEVTKKLEALPDWHLAEAAEPSITASFEFDYFSTALAFVNEVGEDAEHLNHHPDIHILWNVVILIQSTHSAGGLTPGDFEIARRISNRHARRRARR